MAPASSARMPSGPVRSSTWLGTGSLILGGPSKHSPLSDTGSPCSPTPSRTIAACFEPGADVMTLSQLVVLMRSHPSEILPALPPTE